MTPSAPAVIVSLRRDTDIDAAVSALTAAGLTPRRVLRNVRVVTGAAADLEALRRVPGVAAVELDRVVTADWETELLGGGGA